ncbi:hypothetical protein GN956_G15310 [Arapaima gigas]
MKPESAPETADVAELYAMAGMPDLLPPASPFQPLPDRYEPNYGQVLGHEAFNSHLRCDSPQVRRGQRAPKLGQIGRSRKVDIEDEDLDDMLNNNSPFPVAVNLLPVA